MKSLNPFSIYTFAWSSVVLLYFLNWSSLYPTLKLPLLLFLLFTCLFSLMIANKKKNSSEFKRQKLSCPNRFKTLFALYTAIVYFLLLLEFVNAGGIPLFMYASQLMDDRAYQEFGLPVIKVFVSNSFSAIYVFSFYCFISAEKGKRKFWLLLMVLSIIPPIICVQRGIVLNQIACHVIIYLMFNKVNIKKSASFIMGFIVIMYLFGVVGNMRSAHSDEDIFVNAWEANGNFEKTGIPNPFFWGYIYATSPLANLQNAIEKSNVDLIEYNFYNFIVFDIMPQIISKNIEVVDEADKYFVHPTLVVCTTYIHSLLSLGWMGMFLMYIYMVIFCCFFSRIIRVDSPYRIPVIAILGNIMFFCIFDNMVHYMGTLPQIAVFLVLSGWFRNNKKLGRV